MTKQELRHSEFSVGGLSGKSPWPWVFAPHAVLLAGSFFLWLLWMHGGTEEGLVRWMRGPGSVLLLLSPLAEAGFCWAARSQFQPGQQGRRTWTCLGAAASSRFVGTLIAQWLPAIGLLDFIYKTPAFGDLRWFGYFLSGTVAIGFYLAGLFSARATYRRFLRLPRLDWRRGLALVISSLFVAQQSWTLVANHRDQLAHPANWLNWATDPLLLLLLGLTMQLCQTTGCREGGLLGRVWMGYAAGFFLMLAGDFGNWLFNMGYVSWIAASPLAWFAWYPASAGLMAGACCQWYAGVLARRDAAAAEPAVRESLI